MTKIIRIRSCSECNYKNRTNRRYPYYCVRTGRTVDYPHGKTPEWCPLEDAPKAEDKEIDAGVNFIMDTSFGGK